jgi:hypothetical protein
MGDAVEALVELLSEAGLRLKVATQAVPRSPLYDLDYRVCVVALAFSATKERSKDSRRVQDNWLKLVQFVATRPGILPAVKEWVRDRKGYDQSSQRLRRGFLGDTTYDSVVGLLIACGVFVRDKDELLSGPHSSFVRDLTAELAAKNLLATERSTIAALAELKPNKTMLAGR